MPDGRAECLRMARASSPKKSLISLFSGALGLDLGLGAANFELAAAVEVNRWAVATAKRNSEVSVIDRRLEDVKTAEILSQAGISPGELTLLSAGPSCQTFSTAGHRRSLDDDRGWLFKHFLRVVREAQPRFFVMENVRGVLSAAIRHRPLAQRGPGFPVLEPDEQHGSALALMVREFRDLGYYVVFGMLDAADYGAGQHRHRLFFLGSRDGEDLRLPAPTHSADPQADLAPHVTLREALDGLDDPEPVCKLFPPEWRKYLALIPPGGNWRQLPVELQSAALGRAYDSWGGRNGFFRRLSWDRPSPALTTNPSAKATMLGHPDELRTLSVRECARLQGFPDHWVFEGGPYPQFTQIGNAVPTALGQAVGAALAQLIDAPGTASTARLGDVACPDPILLKRLNARPRTVLNPQRMRKDGSLAAARAWMGELGGSTRPPLDVTLLEAA